MEKSQLGQQPQLDLSQTTPVKGENGELIFKQGLLLRKVSKFLAGTPEDGLIPIPIIYEPKTGKIVKDSIPEELRGEYKDHLLDD